MECAAPELLWQWIDRWKDLVAFEAIPVTTSAEAAAATACPKVLREEFGPRSFSASSLR